VTRSAAAALRWLPVLAALAYLGIVAAAFADIERALYWDSDAAAPFVLAERLRGEGPVSIPHFGSWSSLWWLLATRHLPGHVELWKATGYTFALAAVGLLGWTTARVAGRWPGVTAAATALMVGPLALRSQLTVTYHVVPPFTAAVLAAYLVTLGRNPSRAVGAVMGVVAGVNAASDPLVWIVAIVPFGVAAAVLVAAGRRSAVAVAATMALAFAVVSAAATNVLMHSLGFHVVAREVRPAHLGDLPGHALDLARMIALLGGANYALPDGYPAEPLRIFIAAVVLVAVAAAVFAAAREIARRAEPTLRAYACYWASAAVLLGVAFVGTNNAAALGAGSFNYLLALALAAGAGLALAAAGSRRREIVVAILVAAVGAVNAAGIAAGRAESQAGAIGSYEGRLVRLLERKAVTRGYAGYWDAASLSWQSEMKLRIAPVARCNTDRAGGLCPYEFFTIASWYRERQRPSFLIVDPETAFVTAPPPLVGEAAESYHFGPLTVYLFRYDLARYIHAPER
jgi:hypothetical protein